MRFKESIELGDEVYCIFSARKKNGKPKEGEPGKYIWFVAFIVLHYNVHKMPVIYFPINLVAMTYLCVINRLARELED